MNFLRSSVFSIIMTVSIILFAPLVLIAAVLPFKARYYFATRWPRFIIATARVVLGIRYEVRGAHHIPKDHPVIYLMKHQSAYETLFIPWFSTFPVAYIYKRSLEFIPLFGWALATLNNIPIDRSKGAKAMQDVLRKGSARIKEGRSPVLFPEGTRIPAGMKGRYKAGGMRLATYSGCLVIPVAHNAGTVWPKNAFIKTPGLVTLSFGPPIDPKGLRHDDLGQQVEDWIESEMININPEAYPSSNPADTPVYTN